MFITGDVAREIAMACADRREPVVGEGSVAEDGDQRVVTVPLCRPRELVEVSYRDDGALLVEAKAHQGLPAVRQRVLNGLSTWDLRAAEATYRDGLLTVTVPRRRPETVRIEVSD